MPFHSKPCGTEILSSVRDDFSFLRQSTQCDDFFLLTHGVILLRTTFVDGADLWWYGQAISTPRLHEKSSAKRQNGV